MPTVQDIMASAILFVVYFMRVASAGDPDIATPWYLSVMTDVMIPAVAVTWMFVAAMFVVIERTGNL
jgi:hypothetical protein